PFRQGLAAARRVAAAHLHAPERRPLLHRRRQPANGGARPLRRGGGPPARDLHADRAGAGQGVTLPRLTAPRALPSTTRMHPRSTRAALRTLVFAHPARAALCSFVFLAAACGQAPGGGERAAAHGVEQGFAVDLLLPESKTARYEA